MVFPVCLPGGPMTMTYGSWRLQPRYAAVLAHGWPCGRARTALRLSGEINDERDDTGRVRPLFALVVPGARVGEVCEALTEGPPLQAFIYTRARRTSALTADRFDRSRGASAPDAESRPQPCSTRQMTRGNDTLEGGPEETPALVGNSFVTEWQNQTLNDLAVKVSSMPPDRPGPRWRQKF